MGSPLAVPAADLYPCLWDRSGTTPFDSHYLYQGAWLARRLAETRPQHHVDVASSALTISVLSAFVPTTFVDVRPLEVALSRLESIRGELYALAFESESVASISCLHVIEHVGLGRYGDPLDPIGHERAAQELARVLATGGRLYVSTPVGRERVCFNAHRVFSARTVVRLFAGLNLREFSLVGDDSRLHEHQQLDAAAQLDYGCGLFIFEKLRA
ncbi:MAG: DUF268 domain-containing protein [Burkholderiaceae bacterium]|nr:DUF268 domain-containing protein [Burkholderiaceae bacterium]